MSNLLKTVHVQRDSFATFMISQGPIYIVHTVLNGHIAYLLNGASVGTLEKGPHHSNTFH